MCVPEVKKDNKTAQNAASLQLNSIRKSLPDHVFEKSLLKSVGHLIFDAFMWLGSLSVLYALINSNLWAQMPFWLQAVASLVYWNIAGFFMWCLFVVGHDCGHGTFSEYEWVNDIFGHIVHGSIMVPFWPWQLSHRRHHMYHNHETKDYSHAWYTPERMARSDEGMAQFFDKHPSLMATFPCFGWFVYLASLPDGCHFFPFASQVKLCCIC
jgi:omega-3 fatty acid desaturase (delta-15 desaturase)